MSGEAGEAGVSPEHSFVWSETKKEIERKNERETVRVRSPEIIRSSVLLCALKR